MPKYIVRPGASFRLPDGSVKTAGDEIELDSDVAAANPNSVDPVPETDPAPVDATV
jgi:hypothetical protein